MYDTNTKGSFSIKIRSSVFALVFFLLYVRFSLYVYSRNSKVHIVRALTAGFPITQLRAWQVVWALDHLGLLRLTWIFKAFIYVWINQSLNRLMLSRCLECQGYVANVKHSLLMKFSVINLEFAKLRNFTLLWTTS